MIAYCGLNCSKCDAYLATVKNDEAKREAVARKWSELYRGDIKAGQINCRGCRSDGTRFFHCTVCET